MPDTYRTVPHGALWWPNWMRNSRAGRANPNDWLSKERGIDGDISMRPFEPDDIVYFVHSLPSGGFSDQIAFRYMADIGKFVRTE